MEEVEARITPSNLNLSAAAMPSIVPLGSQAMISGSVSASDPMSSLSFTYLWGDSSSTTDPHSFSPPNSVYPFTGLHTYSAAGEYSVTVTANATYAGGGSDSAQATYSVTVLNPTSPPPPPPIFPPPTLPALADVRIETVRDTVERPGIIPSELVGQFNVVRFGGDYTQPLNVFYTVSFSSTATPGMDYQPLSGMLTFAATPPGSPPALTATISLTTIDDLIWDPNENIKVILQSGVGYHVLTPAGLDTITIEDNDLDAIPDSASGWLDNPLTIPFSPTTWSRAFPW